MAAGKPALVVSAVNLVEAGPLSILRDCLAYASRALTADYRVIALVHRASLVDAPGVELREFPDAKRSWGRRLWHEYVRFRAVSRELQPYLWLSLHDITPAVHAERQAVYCHNPSPFYRLRLADARLDPRFALFALGYGWLYRINLHRNRFVVVQQDWLRNEFESRFGVRSVVVAHPDTPPLASGPQGGMARAPGAPTVFFYPALPRVFKNFEAIAAAVERLRADGVRGFEVRLTIDGSENRYARHLAGRLSALPEVRLLGRQSRDGVYALYREADCLLFPSRLETWGLPITEFKATGRPMLVADCRYAVETVGDYPAVAFHGPDDGGRLAALMRDVIDRRFRPEPRRMPVPREPFARDWARLFEILLRG